MNQIHVVFKAIEGNIDVAVQDGTPDDTEIAALLMFKHLLGI